MLDPITSLAFSMQSAKGVYALLLGSGISRSAKIPTGWEIALELVRKIAAVQGAGELPGDSAEAWYRYTFGHAPDYAKLLDGLAVCGWSADWDQALRNAIERAPTRRYLMYWAARGTPSATASALIDRRAGVRLSIQGADEFFDDLDQKVRAIEAFDKPHPMSAELAVATLKEFLADPKDRIRLDDLIGGELERVLKALDDPVFSTHQFSESTANDLARRYESASSTLVAMAFTAGRWSASEQVDVWVDIVKTLGGRAKDKGGFALPIDLMLLPASLVLHACGLGAIAGKRYQEPGRLMTAGVDFGDGLGTRAAGDRLNASTLLRDGQDQAKKIEGYAGHIHALSNHLADVLRPIAKRTLRDDVSFERAFLTIELALALGFADREPNRTQRANIGLAFWAPNGRYAHNAALRQEVLDGWRLEATKSPQTSLSAMAGLTETPKLDEVEDLAERARWG